MRFWPALVSAALVAGCAGNVADYVGPRAGIITPQLVRYGMEATQSQCVAAALAQSLTPLQLRQFVRISETVREGYFEPGRLTVRDLMHVAGSMSDPQVRLELARATDSCGVTAEPAPPAPQASGPAGPRPPAWLNLGAAPTGQSIAVDASTLEQIGTIKKAWFRLTNPNEPAPTGVSYLLNIDCAGRTIEALAHRVQDSAGAVTDYREYARDAEGPLPIEGGTVMEIAYLALCT